MHPTPVIATGAAAVLLAVCFLIGDRVRPLGRLLTPQGLVSFGGGMAAAYVFLHLMPELASARLALVDGAGQALPYEGKAIYYFALIGFLVFYGFKHFHAQLTRAATEALRRLDFPVQLGGFALYAWLVSFLLVRGVEGDPGMIALYAVAMGLHCAAISRALNEEYGLRQRRCGRFVLAGMVLIGWMSGLLVDLPPVAISLLLAFLSGALIMNSLIWELPAEESGRFLPFMMGGMLYGLLLLPVD